MTKRPHLFRETIACFSLLSLGTAVVYGHVTLGLWQGRTPGQFDVRHYFVPMSFLFDFAIHHGEFPAWNPVTFCGTPFAANPQSIVFYPPQLLRSLLTTTVTPLNTYFGLVILIALQSIAAGIGTYFYARTFRLGYVASLTAAMTFTFGVCLTRRVVALQFASTLMWIPFLLLSFHQMLRAQRTSTRVFYCCGCGLLMGLSVLSGFVHIHTYIGVMLVAYWIANRVLGINRRDAPHRRAMAKELVCDAGYIVGLVAIAAGISAAMLIPAAEFAPYTNRAGEYMSNLDEQERSVSVVLQAMLGPAGVDADEPEWSMGYRTAGLSVFLLAIAGLLGSRKKEAFAHFAVFLALLDCTFGPPFPIATVVEHLNPFRMVAPSRAFVVGNLPLAIAAGFGVEALTTMARTQPGKILRTILILIGGIILIRVSTIPLSDITAQLLALTVLLIIAANWVTLPRLSVFAACTILFAECLAWNYRCLPILINKTEFIDVRSHADVITPQWEQNLRIPDPAPNAHAYSLTPAVNGYDPLYIREIWNLLAPPFYKWNYDRILRAPDTVRDNPRTMLLLKRNFWLTRQYVKGPLPPPDRLFAPTTTAFIRDTTVLPIPEVSMDSLDDSAVSATTERSSIPIVLDTQGTASQTTGAELKIPDTTPVQLHRVLSLQYAARCDGELQVWMIGGEPETAIPVFTTHIAPTGETGKTLTVPLADLTNARVLLMFDSRKEDCDFEWRHAELLIDHEDENDRITITSRSFNAAKLEVGPLEAHRLLVFLDADYPGWIATVDGEPAEILRVDDAFKGVVVSPGTHTVEFLFRSARIRWGMAISTIALLMVCASALWKTISDRH